MSAKTVLKLFLRRNDFRCNFVFSLMNYNKVNFDLFVEHFLSGMHVTKDQNSEAQTLPLLRIEKDKKVFIYEGDRVVLDTLKQMNLLKRGITYSAWETQSCEWLLSGVVPSFEAMVHSFPWHLSESYINAGVLNARVGDYLGGFLDVIRDTVKLQMMYRQFWLMNKGAAKRNFQKALEQWEERLGTRDFHGDNAPDKADFLMFSMLGCYQMRMKTLLAPRIRTQLWRDRMTKLVDQQVE